MKPRSDDDLLAIFSQVRRCDREDAPAWRPELLDEPWQRPGFAWRWALMTASVIVLAVFLTHMPRHEPPLSEALPPLFDSPPGVLFASVGPSLLTFEA
ncbi:hypothetical protein, partial [Prosthecobacter sp.]|uniref:hypothetical protein n=1 Tax=Prosthecobacter sp. TaxID=1965333 RepID=UPI0024877D22